jgi:Tol biopolymer transport system component
VALKILSEHLTHDPARVVRFQLEAKAASSLNHANIVTIYEIGQAAETWFIATELIEGVTLRERLSQGKLTLEEAGEIAIQCAAALGAAHRAGIIHRDIKPENIMVRPDDVAKIVDFGLARILEPRPEWVVEATQTGSVMGTPRYMSPEQARGQKLDATTDIFSLGAVLYEMVTSRPAFPGASTAEIFAALLDSVPRAPSEWVDAIPPQLDVIVSKALEKDREVRYQTMQEFAADLQNLQHHLQTGPAISISDKRSSKRSDAPALSRRAIIIAGAGTAAAFALAWYERVTRKGNDRDAPTPTVVPLTTFAGFKDFGSLSPDGNSIAFSWNGGWGRSGGRPERNTYPTHASEALSIYTKRIGPDDPVRLTFAPEDDRLPAWSPDGQYIAFCRLLVAEPTFSRYAIYVVPASGGQEREITEAGMGVSWSPDGKTLAVAGLPAESGGIFRVSIQTGERRQITTPHPNFDTLPVFSPDGRWIAFTRNFSFSAQEIFVVPAIGGPAKRLTFDRTHTYRAAWTPDNHEIVFSSNRGVGGESLWRIATKGGSPRRLSATLQGGFYPSISRQGNHLVYTDSFEDTNIYARNGPGFQNRSVPGPFGKPRGLIMSSRRDDGPSISPDGERIAFVSTRTGNEEIWVCDRNGGRLLQLTNFESPGGAGTPRWSPDGRWVAFDSSAEGNPNIYIVSSDGGTPHRLTTGPSGNFMPSWSHDGRWLYFKSQRSGSDQMWRIPATRGSAIQVTHYGGSEPFASPDGNLVYYTKKVWGQIWTVPVEGGPEKPLPELESFGRIFRSWGVVDQGIYFVSREELPYQTIRFFSFATRQVTPLVTLDRDPIWNVALSRDGRLLLYACLDQEVNDLMLIGNFH